MMREAAMVGLAFVLAGCALEDDPQAAAPGTTDGNVHVYTSNQSFEEPTVDIRVTIDGEVVFDGEAKVESQHNWMLREAKVAAGSHTVTALERGSGATDSRSFSLPQGQERWIVVDYWGAPQDGTKAFTITVHDEQVAFA